MPIFDVIDAPSAWFHGTVMAYVTRPGSMGGGSQRIGSLSRKTGLATAFRLMTSA